MLEQTQLDRLELLWMECRDPLLAQVRPGLDLATMDSITTPLGLRLPAELRRWFAWRDGAMDHPAQRDGRIGGSVFYYSLGVAVAEHRWLTENATRDKETSLDPEFVRLWPRDLLPIGRYDHDAVFACQCSGETLAPVYLYDPQVFDSLAQPLFQCLGDLVARWIRAYESGYYMFDPELGRMVPNFDALSPAEQRGV